GYDPPTKTTTIQSGDIKKGSASLGEITLENRKPEKSQINQENIKPVTEHLPPLSTGPANFKER
ncbi:MAG TPA: hypothetical protein VEI46_02050, partial [Thermodesulfovibrionales bacterium]|nr:hypothetical protein [Thermodesulfovibrionales bacterium]